MRLWDALPGAILAAILLEASFQVLPVFVRLAGVNVTLRVLGGPVILLLWLYVMSNVIVFGAELNWWIGERARHRRGPIRSTASRSACAARARCECSCLPSVAELRDGALLAVGDEHRVVAEALRAARRVGDPTLEHRPTRAPRVRPVRARRAPRRSARAGRCTPSSSPRSFAIAGAPSGA